MLPLALRHPWFWILTLVLGLPTLSKWVRTQDAPWVSPHWYQAERWDPRLYKTLTFGHWASAVDMIWIRFLQDDALYKVPKDHHAPGYYDLDLASELDPANLPLYIYGAGALSVIRDDFQGARNLLIKGEEFRKLKLSEHPPEFIQNHWRQSWALPMTLAYVELFDFDHLPNASAAFRAAGEILDAPPFIQSLAQKLETRDGQFEVGMRLLAFMMESSKDRQAKADLEKKRRSLFVTQYLEHLNHDFLDYLNQFQSYRSTPIVPRDQMNRYYALFKKRNQIPDTDPFGGKILLDSTGTITSTYPRVKVFGM